MDCWVVKTLYWKQDTFDSENEDFSEPFVLNRVHLF